ncbi:MAG: penicillin-binding protein 1A [Spirochaetota bacterium]
MIRSIQKRLLSFLRRRWLYILIGTPVIIGSLVILFTAAIYLSWLADREQALDKLSRYKRLIDRTEEMREGMIYAAGDFGLEEKVVDLPTSIYDRNGELLGQFFSQKREIVPYSYVPEELIQSVIASEDRDFFQHKGVNYKGIARAFLVNLRHMRVVQGGSTITQQLAKVLFTSMERSMKRKIYEFFCAREIERHYDKQDILSMYLNLIYFGNGSYGVEATAKMFFGKSVRKCTEIECAMIVASISNPTIYSPLSDLDNSLSKTRRIIESMVETGYFNKERATYQYDKFLKTWDVKFNEDGEAVESLIGSFINSTYRVNRAPFYNEQIRRLLVKEFGSDVLKRGGLSVYTTLDAEHQDEAQLALRSGVERQRSYHLERSKNMSSAGKKAEEEKAANIQGALVSIDPATGEILAYVGGYEFSSKSQLDHIAQVRRQPGSSIKPLLYCSALENKDINPSTVFIDEPTTFSGDYEPKNYSGSYEGPIIVREALRKSVNVIAVKVLEKTGYDTVFSYLRKSLDIDNATFRKRFKKTPSFALGTYELSPLENVTLHATMVNGGHFIKPYGIRYIKDYSGRIIMNSEEELQEYVRDKRKEYDTIMDPIACAITVSMLKGALQPGGTAYGTAARYGIDFPAAGKTGTSTNFNDAWFVGYTPKIVTAVWVGNSKGAISLGQGRAGGTIAAPVWGQYISRTYNRKEPGAFQVPDEGIAYQTIDLESGKVPRQISDPGRVAVDELFYQGTEPGEYAPEDYEEEVDHVEQADTDE